MKNKKVYEIWKFVWFLLFTLWPGTYNALNSINTWKHEIILRALIFAVPFAIFGFVTTLQFSCIFILFFFSFIFFICSVIFVVWHWILDIFSTVGVVVIVFAVFYHNRLPFQLLSWMLNSFYFSSLSKYYDIKAMCM